MSDPLISVGGLLLAFFLVFLNGFFVASEFALVRIRPTAVQSMVNQGHSGATLLQAAMDQLDDYLAVTQLGITISSLGLGWVGEPAVASLIEPVLASVLPHGAIRLVAFALGFAFITFLHVVFGELAPKTIAIAQAERIAIAVALPMKFFYYLFRPGIIVFNGTANFFTQLVGVPPAHEAEETLTEEEMLMVVRRSGRHGHVDEDEVAMVERVFDLDDIMVREVMVPRPDVVDLTPDAGIDEIRAVIRDAGHTRYPIVAAENGEEVIGLLDVKDVLVATDPVDTSDGELTAGDLVRDLPAVPETAPLDQLLRTMQDERSQMVAVIDEWGAFEGIATVEDIVEELVGELHDEFDLEGRPAIDRAPDGTVELDGSVAIDEVNEVVGSDFESEAFETAAGLVLERLGRAPEVGDTAEVDGFLLEVTAVDANRIERIRLTPPPRRR